ARPAQQSREPREQTIDLLQFGRSDPCLAARRPELAMRTFDDRLRIGERAFEIAFRDAQNAADDVAHGARVCGRAGTITQAQALAAARARAVAPAFGRDDLLDHAAVGELAQVVIETIGRTPEPSRELGDAHRIA